MKFLKKLSVLDVLVESNILEKYKEIEFYTTWSDIETYSSQIDTITNKLQKYHAVIRAVHVANSLFPTSSDIDISSNYMSICEILSNSASENKFKTFVDFVEKLNNSQWEKIDAQTDSSNDNKKKIILIVHAGCQKGCKDEVSSQKTNCVFKPNNDDKQKTKIQEMIKDKNIEIAIENITPYYDANDNTIAKGKNCGWNNNIDHSAFALAKKLKVKVCLDVCHIFASHNIMNGNEDYITALNDYKKTLDDEDKKEVVLFHISNYDKKGLHGVQFAETNTELVDTVRNFCFDVSPHAYATLEVAGGNEIEKGAYNFDSLMIQLSEKHTSGLFGKLLAVECNKELKQFFDNMFYVYSCDYNNTFDIKERTVRIKKFIILNTYINIKSSNISVPFGFTKESNTIDVALFRMQAYIYYIRFCNLGLFLAKYYDDNNIIDRDARAEDFGLALTYFMLNDDVKQVDFTGLAFHFNVDWLPRKETFFRFYDGIKNSNLQELCEGEPYVKNIMENIREHISGINCRLFSCGKNFGMCLFKYWRQLNIQNLWTVRVYQNQAINFVKYDNRLYSIPAFMQTIKNENFDKDKIENFSFDMSEFNNGRGGGSASLEDATTLFSLLKYYTGQSGIAETVGSVADGEIVFLSLPDCTKEYAVDNFNSLLLFKAYIKRKEKNFDLKTTAEQLMKQLMKQLEAKEQDIKDGLNNCLNNKNDQSNDIIELLGYISKDERNDSNDLLEKPLYCKGGEKIKNLFRENYKKILKEMK